MAANTSISEAPTRSTDFGSFLISANKVVFTSYGPSRLLAFDQVNAYIIGVEKGPEPVYTCLSVIALEPLPGDDIEIDSIAINHDFTRAALIGRRNVYAFVIPNPRGQSGVLRVAGSGQKRLTASLLTIGPLPCFHTVVKAAWLPSSVIRGNQKFADVIGVLFSDSVLRVYDVKYPQKEVSLSFREAIITSVKEDFDDTENKCFTRASSLGLTKSILSFDFGLLFDEKGTFFTVFAIDNDSELYYGGVALSGGELTAYSITGPIPFQRGAARPIEPLDLAFIEHESSDSVALLAIAFDDGSIANVGGFLYLSWDTVLKGKECMRFFTLDTLDTGTALRRVQLLPDRSSPGEYFVCDDHAVFIVSIQPWLPKLGSCIVTGKLFNVGTEATIICHCFQLIAGSGTFRSVAILADTALNDKKSRLDRYLLAVDSEGQVHGRFVSRLYKPFSIDSTSVVPKPAPKSTPNTPLIATTNIVTNVPKLKKSELEELECLNLFTKYFKAMEEQVLSNINLIKDAINKCDTLKSTHSEQTSAQDTFLKRIVSVADQLEALQPVVDRCLPAVEKLSNRMDRIYAAIPREQLTKAHIENEERIYTAHAEIQQNLAKTRNAAVETVMLRSEYVRRQPSFAPSVSATRFMLTKASLDAEVLKTEVDKLTSKVEQLNSLADTSQRTSDA